MFAKELLRKTFENSDNFDKITKRCADFQRAG